MAAKTSAAKKKAGSGGRSAKKTTSGVKAVHSTKPSGRTTSKTTAHKKNGSGGTSKASRTGTNTYRRRTIEEMNEYQDHIAFEQGMTILLNCAVLVLCYVSFFGLAGQFGAVIKNIFMKLFGWTAWMIPMAIVLAVIFSIVNPGDKRVPRRIASGTVIVLALMGLTGSGIVGKYIDLGVFRVLGEVGGYCVLGALLLVSIYIFYGIEWMAMLRKRNAYYQEMGEAYEVIRQEEDYTVPSYKVRPPKRRKIYSDHQMQSVNLQQMNEQIDRMQEKEQENRKNTNTTKEKAGKLEEILPSGKSVRTQTQEQESIEHQKVQQEEQHMSVEPSSEIPIYREELRRKFDKPLSETITSPLHEQPSTQSLESYIAETKENMTQAMAMTEKVSEEPKKPAKTSRTNRNSLNKAERSTTKSESSTVRGGSGAVFTYNAAEIADAFASGKEKMTAKQSEEQHKPYEFPPVELLSVPKEIPGRVSDSELRETAARLQDTLRSFNVNVTMGPVTCGPTVTRFEVLPEQGVRVNKITNLTDDLKLSLAAPSVRIEAPIPGKSAVGIEVPNPEPSPVYFRELLEGDDFRKAKSPVTFAVGKDIAGKRIMTDIAKMPHLLIAGATGSGKSVCINTLIMSILYKADPSDVKLIMIDPKVVELSVYNGIPHLFCPVVTDPREAASALNWAVREMMERYNLFKELGVRNISGYNQKIKTVEDPEKAGYSKMPSLVIIVDEFADLMMVASKEVEDAVCRLAQLARAAGIHLVLATQRPSVNVITGVIKANIPSRIAFSVSSAIDSRTILDKGGAEKLLGKGDMLFFPSGESEPVRVQGAFVSDKEVSDVVEFLCEANEEPEYNHEVTAITEEPDGTVTEVVSEKPDVDEYFADAGRFVIESERAAAGQLQRRFSIGFNRAGRIIDQLHQAGVVGPAEGTKPRKVLMTMEQFEAYLSGGDAATEADELEAYAQELSASDMLENPEHVISEEQDPLQGMVDDLEEHGV